MSKPNQIVKILFTAFSVFGLIFLAVAVFLTVRSMEITRSHVKTDATIVDFSGYDSNWEGEHRSSRSTIVEYQAGGATYQADLHSYSSSWQLGDKVTVYFDPQNPRDVTSGLSNLLLPLIFGILGLVFALTGLIGLAVQWRSAGKKRRLRETGLLVYGEIVDVYYNEGLSVNGRHPLVAECKYVDGEGTVHIFRSDSIWKYLDPEVVGQRVPVYVEPDNLERYYVDVDALEPSQKVVYHR